MKSKRKEALDWWRNLSKQQKKQLAEKHFSDLDFWAITTSSNRIERIFKQEFTAI